MIKDILFIMLGVTILIAAILLARIAFYNLINTDEATWAW